MADEPRRRLYSEQEVGRLLKRATEIQEAAGSGEAAGISLEELQQIASEIGIDSRHLLSAVAEDRSGGTGEKRFHILGGPVTMHLERVIAGEVTEAQWEEILDEVRQTFNLVGVSGQVGHAFEWTHSSRRRQVQVRLRASGGKTRIRIDDKYPQTALLTFLIPMMVAYLAVGILLGILDVSTVVLGASLAIGILGSAFLAMRLVYGRVTRKKERDARALLARVEHIVSGEGQAMPGTSLPEADARRTAATALDDEHTEEPAAERAGRRERA